MKTIHKVEIVAAMIATAVGAKILLMPSPKTYYATIVNNSFVVDGKNTKDSTGKTVLLNSIDTIRIKPGKYSGGSITNIPAGIYIAGEGVEVIGSLTQNITLVYIANSTGFTLSGPYIHDNNYTAISINGPEMDDVTFKNIKIDNINNYVFRFEKNFNLLYNGSNNTVCENFKFLNIEATKCSLLFSMPGGVTSAGVVGLFRNLEVAYCHIHDAPNLGNVMWCGAAEDYNIHDNKIDGINQNDNRHNGIFHMYGNGKFCYNWIRNHQGNAIRAWQFSVGTTPKTTEICNNFVFNSRMYSAFELQTPADAKLIVAGKTTYANAKVYNNTAIQIKGIVGGFDGVMLDLYGLSGGTTEYYNNLGAEMYAQKGVTDMVNMGNDKIIRKENNVYKTTWQQAVADLVSFPSLIPNCGALQPNIPSPPSKPIDTILKPVPIDTTKPNSFTIDEVKKLQQRINALCDSVISEKQK